jgi:RNA polymerase sigma-70 factor (ECF subfamily)
MDTLQEQHHIEQTLGGNHAAFAALVDTHKDHVFTLIWRIVGQRERAEELTQDVFLKAFQHLHAFNRQAKLSTWLYRIAYNTAISETRRRKMPLQELQEDHRHIPDFGEAPTSREQQLQTLNAAINRLPPEEAALISLFYTENKPMEEISQITGLSLSNVKTKIHRTRNKLRKLIEGNTDDE